jgi:hypothetical protein
MLAVRDLCSVCVSCELLLMASSLTSLNQGQVSPLMVAAGGGSMDVVKELCVHEGIGCVSKSDKRMWKIQRGCAILHAARSGEWQFYHSQ